MLRLALTLYLHLSHDSEVYTYARLKIVHFSRLKTLRFRGNCDTLFSSSTSARESLDSIFIIFGDFQILSIIISPSEISVVRFCMIFYLPRFSFSELFISQLGFSSTNLFKPIFSSDFLCEKSPFFFKGI